MFWPGVCAILPNRGGTCSLGPKGTLVRRGRRKGVFEFWYSMVSGSESGDGGNEMYIHQVPCSWFGSCHSRKKRKNAPLSCSGAGHPPGRVWSQILPALLIRAPLRDRLPGSIFTLLVSIFQRFNFPSGRICLPFLTLSYDLDVISFYGCCLGLDYIWFENRCSIWFFLAGGMMQVFFLSVWIFNPFHYSCGCFLDFITTWYHLH